MSLANAAAVTTLTAEDVERAKAFWTEKLGLEVEPTEDPGGGFYLKAGNGTKVFVYNSGAPKATNTVVSFKVDDVLGMVKSLKEKGVEFESYDSDPIKTDEDNIARMGDMEAAWFKDSEGNIVCVSNM
jgi:catechol 2,3-dioxygenase-like lactoylglutathione lyase family enzyme